MCAIRLSLVLVLGASNLATTDGVMTKSAKEQSAVVSSLVPNLATSDGVMTKSDKAQGAVRRRTRRLAVAQAVPQVASSLGPDLLVHVAVNAGGAMQSETEPALEETDDQEQDASNPAQLLELLNVSLPSSSPAVSYIDYCRACHKGLKSAWSKTQQFLSSIAQNCNVRFVAGITAGIMVLTFLLACACCRSSKSGQSTNDIPRSLEDCRTVVDCLGYWVSLTPEKTLFTWVDKEGREVTTFTYHKFQTQSSALASKLRHCWKVLEGDRALLVYEPCLSFNVALVACLKTGVIAVPVYPPNPANLKKDLPRFTAFAHDCNTNVALTSSAFYWGTVWTIWQAWPDLVWHVTDSRATESISSKQCDGLMMDPAKLAFLQYTSGSTGEPKGVMITHANLLHNTLIWSPHDVWDGQVHIGVSWLPQYHDMGLVAMMLATVTDGGTLIEFSPADFIKRPMLWLELITRYRAAVTASPHFGWKLAAKSCRRQNNPCSIDLSSLRMALDAAEPIQYASQAEVIKVLQEHGLRDGVLSPGYGLAEHTVKTCHSACIRWEKGRAGLGPPCFIPGCPADQAVVVKIVNPETCAELPHGEEGEVWVDSPSKAKGYFGKPQLTKDVFYAQIKGGGQAASNPDSVREFLRTGDKGFIKDGVLFLSGRYKNIIIVGGRNYHPHDIEQTVEQAGAPYLRPGCIAAVGLLGGTEQVVIAAEVRPQAYPADLGEIIRKQVEQDHGIDVHGLSLLTMRSIPKTTSGKLRHSEIARLWKDGPLPGELDRKCWDHVADVMPIIWDPKGDRKSRQAQVSAWLCDELGRMTGGPVSEDMKLEDVGLTSLGTIRLNTRLHAAAATTTDADLTDLQSSAPQVRQRLPEEALGIAELFELGTVQAIANAIERAKFPTEEDLERERRPVSKHEEREQPYEGIPLPSTLVYSLQMIGVVVLILGIAVAVSATLEYRRLVANLDVPWWLHFLALAFSFPVWMLLFSVEVAVVKWLIVGSYRPCRVARWSLGFLQWWLVDRFVDFWERFVGCWLAETPILNIFYICCGAQIAVTAQLVAASLREFDLVVIGDGAEVDGDLVCRVIRPNGLEFGIVHVGAGAEIQAGALVPLMVDVQKDAVLKSMSVPDSGVTIPAGEVWHGHPATKVCEGKSTMKSPTHAIVVGKTLLLLLQPVLVYGMSTSLVWVAGDSMRRVEPDALISPSTVGHLFVLGACAAVAVLVLKWILFWRVKPNQVTGSAWWKLRVFFLGLWFRLALCLFLAYWVDGMPSAVRLWYRLLGSQIHHGAIIFNILAVAPQWADLVEVGPRAFLASCTVVPSEARPVSIGEKASLGLDARVEGGCTIRDGAAIGPLTLLQAGTDVASCEFRLGSRIRTTQRNVATTHVELLAWHSIAQWLLRLGSIALFTLTTLPLAKISSSIESPAYSLAMAIPTWFLAVFVCNWLITKALHPCRELQVSTSSFTAVAWAEYCTAQWWAVGFVMPFLDGSWLAARWHQGLGARTACDALWFGTAHMDQPLLDVGHGAVVDGRVLTGHSRLPDGTLHFKRSTLGDGACLYPGAVVLAGTEVPQDTTLGFKSYAHYGMKTPGRIWSGIPASLPRRH